MKKYMMTVMMNRIKLACILVLFPFILSGQDSDFGLWYEFSTDYKLVKRLRVDFEGSIRTDENASHIEKFYFEPGIRYKISKNFSAGLYYRLIEQKEDDENFYARHRWSAQFKGELPVGRFTFSARERFQTQIKMYIENAEDELPEWYNRLRLEAEYDVPSIPLVPHLSAEIFSQLFSSNDIAVEKMRYIAGLDYTFNKKHRIGISYVYNTSKVSNPEYMNIIALGYKLKL